MIFTPQTAVTPRHLHTFYIQHSDYVMRTWPAGGPHKNRYRHHLLSTGLKPPGKSFYIICLNYNQGNHDLLLRRRKMIAISNLTRQVSSDWCNLQYCFAGRDDSIMNETNGLKINGLKRLITFTSDLSLKSALKLLAAVKHNRLFY